MAVKAKKRKKTVFRATSKARSSNRKRNRAKNHRTRTVIVMPKSNVGRRKGKRNPAFFGSNASPMKLAEYVAGGLIGVTINRVVLPMLPASVTNNNFFSTLAAFGIALAEWWAASMISKDFGSAVGFGALMNAGSTALNTFIPQVGSAVGLSGRRGVSDFVGARWTIPDTSVNMLTGNPTTGVSGAYPLAYGRAA